MRKMLEIYFDKFKKTVALNSDNDIIKTSLKLANYIINNYENKIIDYVLNEKYPFLQKSEKLCVKNRCKNIAEEKLAEMQSYIFTKLYFYIQTEDILIVEGFIRFRIGEYIKSIEEYIDISVNEYITDCEYNQFIDALVMYTEFQNSLIDEIEISVSDGIYNVRNSDGKIIFTLSEFDDILLDILLTLSPENIIVNTFCFNNKELLDVILNIFKNKVVLV